MRARQQQQLTSVAEEAEQACSGRHLPHQCTFCSFLLHFCVSAAVAAAADVVDVQHVCIIAISGAITVREREAHQTEQQQSNSATSLSQPQMLKRVQKLPIGQSRC